MDDEARVTGWWVFAGILLGLAGFLNVVWGIAGISNSKFFTQNSVYVVSSLHTWGWITLIIGVVLGSITIWLADRRSMGATGGATEAVTVPQPHQVLAAAQGRVEGRTENIEVEASIDGLLQSQAIPGGARTGTRSPPPDSGWGS